MSSPSRLKVWVHLLILIFSVVCVSTDISVEKVSGTQNEDNTTIGGQLLVRLSPANGADRRLVAAMLMIVRATDATAGRLTLNNNNITGQTNAVVNHHHLDTPLQRAARHLLVQAPSSDNANTTATTTQTSPPVLAIWQRSTGRLLCILPVERASSLRTDLRRAAQRYGTTLDALFVDLVEASEVPTMRRGTQLLYQYAGNVWLTLWSAAGRQNPDGVSALNLRALQPPFDADAVHQSTLIAVQAQWRPAGVSHSTLDSRWPQWKTRDGIACGHWLSGEGGGGGAAATMVPVWQVAAQAVRGLLMEARWLDGHHGMRGQMARMLVGVAVDDGERWARVFAAVVRDGVLRAKRGQVDEPAEGETTARQMFASGLLDDDTS